jgi:hypothetical protein
MSRHSCWPVMTWLVTAGTAQTGASLPRYRREFLRRSHLAYAESMHSLAACIAARNGGAHAARLGLFWEANPFTEPADTLLRIEWHLGWWDYWLSWRN